MSTKSTPKNPKKAKAQLQQVSPFIRRFDQHTEFLWDQSTGGYDHFNYSPSETSRHISKKDLLFFFTQLYHSIDMHLVNHLTLFNKLILVLIVGLAILFVLLVLFLSYFMYYTTKSYYFYICLLFSVVSGFILIVLFIQNHIKVL